MTVHECAGLARLATKSVLATWMLASIGVAFAQQNWQQIPIPPLPKFAPAQPTRVQLANGMVIFLQEDHELPLISATALIKGGASTEPAEKTGMLSIYAASWRTSGTEKKTGDQLDEQLENIAASVETGIDESFGSASFSCLKENADEVLGVFHDVLTSPAVTLLMSSIDVNSFLQSP